VGLIPLESVILYFRVDSNYLFDLGYWWLEN